MLEREAQKSHVRSWSRNTGGTNLSAYTPVEPADVGRVSEIGIYPMCDQGVPFLPHVLDIMVEVGTGCDHGDFSQNLPSHDQH